MCRSHEQKVHALYCASHCFILALPGVTASIWLKCKRCKDGYFILFWPLYVTVACLLHKLHVTAACLLQQLHSLLGKK